MDKFTRKAKKLGYRASSVFKLLNLNKKYNLIRKGSKVLDLGAAPGSWSQACLDLKASFILAIDLTPIENLNTNKVKTLILDINDNNILTKIPQKFDVVLSDIAPKTTGIIELDQRRSLDLCNRVLYIAENVLNKNGNFLCKIFQSEELVEFLDKLKKRFRFVKCTKPEASKKASKEIYVIAKGFI